MKYSSCSMIENFALNFNGRIDTESAYMAMCCENIEKVPRTLFTDTPKKALERFRRNRAEVIAESVHLTLLGDGDVSRTFTEGCAKCANFQMGDYNGGDGLIHYINLSMYPAPCQCKCIYCGVHDDEDGMFNKVKHGECYEKLFDLLDYAKRKEKIASNAFWQISSGEIAIHPYKDRILSLVKKQHALFYSNCFIYDQQIAENLKANKLSGINLSIDCGTPETWKKIKGVDNFETVTDNLVKYYKMSEPGQIKLKYIVLPGINDTLVDYKSLIEIMKVLEVKHLTIARDTRIKYEIDKDSQEALIGAAGYLLAMLHKNDLTCDMFTYSPVEREQTVKIASQLLRSGEI